MEAEVAQCPRSPISRQELIEAVLAWLETVGDNAVEGEWKNHPKLAENIETLRLNPSHNDNVHKVFVYRLEDTESVRELIDGIGEGDEQVPVAERWLLPSRKFDDLWDSLILEPGVKEDTLRFAMAALRLSNRGPDINLLPINRMALFHGPPGTGKTTLCKALAQKVSIRCGKLSHFVEINSHSLFSKWFSESGKLVMKAFTAIEEMADDTESLVFILVDEVESLAHARSSSVSGAEPSDSIRVVNALLTQLDRIRSRPNVFVLATSNITGAIDNAFADRADIKQHIGLPNTSAIYEIYRTSLIELMRTNVIEKESFYDAVYLEEMGFVRDERSENSLELFELAKLSQGFSGRSLRKLPFIAYALYVNDDHLVKCRDFINYLKRAIDKYNTDNRAFSSVL